MDLLRRTGGVKTPAGPEVTLKVKPFPVRPPSNGGQRAPGALPVNEPPMNHLAGPEATSTKTASAEPTTDTLQDFSVFHTDERGVAYKQVRLIGEGGMGAVYLANGPEGERVALKVIHPGEITKTNMKRFIKEARALEALSGHPNILQLISHSVEATDQPFFVMEFVDGPDLTKLISEKAPIKPADYRLCSSILAQCCTGLSFMHAKGFIHRDLKPSNLFLTKEGTLKIGDLGLVLRSDPDDTMKKVTSRLTRTGSFVGTVGYMAPEQAYEKTYDHRVDIYSLGVIMYEMFCGKLPIENSKSTTDPGPIAPAVYFHMKTSKYGEIPSPNQVRRANNLPPMSAKLEDVIMRAIHPKPETRPTLSEIQEAVSHPKPLHLGRKLIITTLGVVVMAAVSVIALKPELLDHIPRPSIPSISRFFPPPDTQPQVETAKAPSQVQKIFIVPEGTSIIGPDSVKHPTRPGAGTISVAITYPYSANPTVFTFTLGKKVKTKPVDLAADGQVEVKKDEFTLPKKRGK
ncbi:serine/threonine protein kinase [Candidatus Micrarchaeota archaeon]|nr:serine/threonine protein kinase [Candidatus Micrarchaeota archaeon]